VLLVLEYLSQATCVVSAGYSECFADYLDALACRSRALSRYYWSFWGYL